MEFSGKKKFGICTIAVCILLLLFHPIGWAAPGDLDLNFDTDGDGIVITDLQGNNTTDTAAAVAVQPDGKILVAGTSGTNKFAVARYLSTGSLDSEFGNNGVTITPLPDLGGVAHSMVLQADGKILLSGIGAGGEFALVRYLASGVLDTSFDSDGIITTPIGVGQAASANAMALQSDGKIVLAGQANVGGGNIDFAVARFNSNGSLDTAFDGDGKLTTPLVALVQDYASAVAVQADGKIVVAGHTNSGKFGVVRYNKDGSLDAGFGNNGIVVTAVGAIDAYAYAIALQPDGKIVVVGNALVDVGYRGLAAVRYNADGSLDNSFGTAGKVITSLAGLGMEGAEAVVVQPDGKIVVTGEYVSSQSPSDLDLAVLRYNSNGGLDTSFGTNGIVTLDLGSLSDFGNGLAVQPDGKILVAGSDSADFVLLRYEGFNLDVTPDAYAFIMDDSDNNVIPSQLQTSNLITVSGLDTGVAVPVSVSGGEYAINGSTTYMSVSAINWVGNNDQINVRHTSAASENTTVSTILKLGGVMAPNGVTHLGMSETVEGTYHTTTIAFPLISPADGATNLGTEVSFVWRKPTNPNGNSWSYKFFLCEDQMFVGCSTTVVASAEMVLDYAGAEGLLSLVLFGTVLGGIGLRRRKWLMMAIVSLAIIGLVSNCGGGGGGGNTSAPTDEMSHTVSGLNPGTTYYWKVTVSDGIDTLESATRSLTTL